MTIALLLLGITLVPPDAAGRTANSNGATASGTTDSALPDLLKITSTPPLYPGDLVLWTLTVTNVSGSTTAYNVKVHDVFRSLIRQESIDYTPGCGEYWSGVWTIGTLPAGKSCSLWVEVLVNTADEMTRTVTSSTNDQTPENNTTVITGLTFTYPSIAQAQAVVVRRYRVLGRDYHDEEKLNRVVLGLFQGVQPANTAVLCSIPVPKRWPVVYTVPKYEVEKRFRPCGEGLPFPLHVNDLYPDQNGTRIWLSAWGSAGLYFSDDNGMSWTAAEPELADQPPGWKNVYMITQDAAGTYYISVNNGLVFSSPNGIDHWRQRSSLPQGASDTPWSLEGDPNEPGVIYAGTFGRGVYVTHDAGTTWEMLHGETVNTDFITGSGGHIFDLEFSPKCSDALFAATGQDVWRIDLTVSGSGWEPTGLKRDPSDDHGLDVRAIAFAPKSSLDHDPDLWAATWGFGVHRYRSPLSHPTVHHLAIPTLRQMSYIAVDPDGEFVLAGGVDGEPELFEQAATSVATEPGLDTPTRFALSQNFPNPFNPSTTIAYELPEASVVRLSVHNMLGREVAVLVDGMQPAGRADVQFDAKGMPSGMYLYRMVASGQTVTRSMMLVK